MPEETPAPVAPTEEAHKVPHSTTLRQEIVSAVAEASPKVRALVIEELVDEEIKRRKELVLKVFNKAEEKKRELRKAESQGVTPLNLQGKATGEPIFTNQQLEAIKKLREEIGKIERALENAFEKGDFKKLNEVAN